MTQHTKKHQAFPDSDWTVITSPQVIAAYTQKAQMLRSQAISGSFSKFVKLMERLIIDLRQFLSPMPHGSK